MTKSEAAVAGAGHAIGSEYDVLPPKAPPTEFVLTIRGETSDQLLIFEANQQPVMLPPPVTFFSVTGATKNVGVSFGYRLRSRVIEKCYQFVANALGSTLLDQVAIRGGDQADQDTQYGECY